MIYKWSPDIEVGEYLCQQDIWDQNLQGSPSSVPWRSDTSDQSGMLPALPDLAARELDAREVHEMRILAIRITGDVTLSPAFMSLGLPVVAHQQHAAGREHLVGFASCRAAFTTSTSMNECGFVKPK